MAEADGPQKAGGNQVARSSDGAEFVPPTARAPDLTVCKRQTPDWSFGNHALILSEVEESLIEDVGSLGRLALIAATDHSR